MKNDDTQQKIPPAVKVIGAVVVADLIANAVIPGLRKKTSDDFAWLESKGEIQTTYTVRGDENTCTVIHVPTGISAIGKNYGDDLEGAKIKALTNLENKLREMGRKNKSLGILDWIATLIILAACIGTIWMMVPVVKSWIE